MAARACLGDESNVALRGGDRAGCFRTRTERAYLLVPERVPRRACLAVCGNSIPVGWVNRVQPQLPLLSHGRACDTLGPEP